jgi:hypothetical protein
VVGQPQLLENALKVVPAALALENEGGCAQSRPQIAPAEIDVQIGASKATVEARGNSCTGEDHGSGEGEKSSG